MTHNQIEPLRYLIILPPPTSPIEQKPSVCSTLSLALMHPHGLLSRHAISGPLKTPRLHSPCYRSTTFAPRRFASQKPNPDAKANTNPSLRAGKSQFKELWRNTSRPAKIVIIIGLTIMGTAETVFWAKVAWAKIEGWRGQREAEERKDLEGAGRGLERGKGFREALGCRPAVEIEERH